MKKLLKKILGPLFSTSSPLYDLYHRTRGWLAATLYGYPGKKLVVIGVTGTNGKTTTCNLIASVLEEANIKTGLITTINFWTGTDKRVNETKMTTLDPFSVQSMLAQMLKAGCTHAVVETSSHSLIQHRVYGIPYDIAVFTNLTPEHLDFHKNMADYGKAKSILFRELDSYSTKPGILKTAVINMDDPFGATLVPLVARPLLYSTKDDSAGIHTTAIQLRPDGSDSHVILPNGAEFDLRLHLPGVFNIYNALGAVGACHALGIPEPTIQRGIAKVTNIAGRMEDLSAGHPFRVIVDYAHTPDGFEQVLSTLRASTVGRLIAVFGAAGDRDKSKRSALGEIASKYADLIYLTEEDPGSEDPLKIIQSIREGLPMSFTEGQNLFIIPVRTEAIRTAIASAQPQDTVALLGMGAQTVIVRDHGAVPYHEREFVKELLQFTNN